ncbi:hypothetical protein D3C71_175010 [compost metagenome]
MKDGGKRAVNLPQALKEDLMASARASGRTLDEEVSERLLRSFEDKPGEPGASERRIEALEHGLAEAMRLIRDLQEGKAGGPSQSRPNADLRAAVAAAETRLGSLTHESGKRYSTQDGKIVRFVMSSPFRGYGDKGFVKIVPGHFTDDYIFLAIRHYHRGWLVPMDLVRSTLERIPTANRTNGEKSWDPTYGNRKGRQALWMGKSGELVIEDHGIDLPSVDELP